MEWISVKDRLPYLDENVIAAVLWGGKEYRLDITWVDEEGEWAMGSAKKSAYRVTHWMPLPDPPKGGPDDKFNS